MKGERGKQLAVLSGFLLMIIYIYWHRAVFAQITGVLLLAIAFSLLLSPVCRWMERRGLSGSLASAISIVFLLLAVLLLGALSAPYLVANSISLLKSLVPSLLSFNSWISAYLAERGIHLSGAETIVENLASSIHAFTSRALNAGVIFARYLGQIAFSLVMAFYMLKERRIWSRRFLLLFPLRIRSVCLSAAQASKNALLGYVSGVLKTSLFVASATLLGLIMLGVKDAFLLAMLMGVLEILPYIGPILASIPILLVAMPGGLHHVIACLLMIIVIQQIESGIVGPYFAASSVSIHPLAALFSVFAFGSLFGFWGILLAVPAVVVFRSIYVTISQAAA